MKALTRRIATVEDASGPREDNSEETEALRRDLADSSLADSIVREALESEPPKTRKTRPAKKA